MSEEGYKNIIKTYEIETNQLYQDISKLENRIDKAIEHIEKEIEYYKDQSGSLMIIEMLECLLEILKGDNNE